MTNISEITELITALRAEQETDAIITNCRN